MSCSSAAQAPSNIFSEYLMFDIDIDIPSLVLQRLPLSADSIELLTQIYDEHLYELVALVVVLLSVVVLRLGFLSGYSDWLWKRERKTATGRFGIGHGRKPGSGSSIGIGIGKGFTGKTGFKMPAASPATVCISHSTPFPGGTRIALHCSTHLT